MTSCKKFTLPFLACFILLGCKNPSPFPEAHYTVIPGVNPAEITLPATPVTPHITQNGTPETILIQMPAETYRTVGAWLRWFWPDDWYIAWDVPDAETLRNTPVSITAESLKSDHVLAITDRWLASLHLKGEINWTRKTLRISTDKV